MYYICLKKTQKLSQKVIILEKGDGVIPTVASPLKANRVVINVLHYIKHMLTSILVYGK